MTVTDYFESIPLNRKEEMAALQKMIKEVFPNVMENMAYKLPTYSFNNLKMCAIASQKNYMALYIMNYDLLVNFNEELSTFNCGKSCIRFKKLNSETLQLFKSILIFVKDNYTSSEFYKKY